MDRRGRAALLSLAAHKMVVSPVEIVHVQAAFARAIPVRLGIPASISFGDSTILVASLLAMVVEEIAGVAKLTMPVALMVAGLFQVRFQARSPLKSNSNRSPQRARQRQTRGHLPKISRGPAKLVLFDRWRCCTHTATRVLRSAARIELPVSRITVLIPLPIFTTLNIQASQPTAFLINTCVDVDGVSMVERMSTSLRCVAANHRLS